MTAKILPAILMAIVLFAVDWQASGQVTETFSFTGLNRSIPDGNAAGLSDRRILDSPIVNMTYLQVRLAVAGEYNGDLYAYLRHVNANGTNFCVLLNRPGRSTVLSSGYDDPGLDVTFDDAASNGNIHLYRTVTIPSPATPLTGSWQPDGRNVDPETVLETDSPTTTLGSFTNTFAAGEWTLFIGDLEAGGTNLLVSWELEITGIARPQVTWPTPANIVYGDPLGTNQLNASSPVSGTFTYVPPPGTILGAGPAQTLSVIFTPANPVTYVPVTTNVNINVLKKDLTITANDAAKIHGEPLPEFSAAYEGFVNGDTHASLDTPVVLNTVAGASSPVGMYPIIPSGAVDANYLIEFLDGTLTISPAATIGFVSSSANPATPGAAVMLTFQVSPVPPGAGTPSGAVQFRVDGTNSGAPVLLSGGFATYSLSTLAAGLHMIVAEYPGDSNFTGTTNELAQPQLINTPPFAGTDRLQRSLTNGVKVLISTLLANDLDADGDTITFVAADSPGANGGSVVRKGNWIHYTPPAGFTNVDSFTYQIVDTYNAAATGVVFVTNQVDTVRSPNLLIADLGNGSFLLRFDAIPGKTYRIEYSETLSTPAWHELGGATADSLGVLLFIDTPPLLSPQRYYRSVYP